MRRFYEILPAALAWATFLLVVLFSWLLPSWVSIFVILFDTYWLMKTIYLSFHLRATFVEMKKNMKKDWIVQLEKLRIANSEWQKKDEPIRNPQSAIQGLIHDWHDIYHLVILPMYDEPYEVVRESFESLTRVHYPKDRLIVVLALEERAGERAQAVGKRIEAEYDSKFYRFLAITHPMDLVGEIPGKGSNESWAAARAKEMIIDPMIAEGTRDKSQGTRDRGQGTSKENILAPMAHVPCHYSHFLVSVFDVDTQVFPEYFGRLAYAYLTAPHPLRSIYQPIPLFVNNVHDTPTFARVVSFSATFWQMMQQSRPERLTSFSSQAMPLQTLVEIGFWQKDIVSEDSRIFWQGYLHYHGDFRVEPLFFPVSMDAAAAPMFWGTVKNLYRQQRRWAWGAENVPYLLDGFGKDPEIPARKKWYWSFNAIEGYHSWATNSLMIFALGWLPLLLGGGHFNQTLLSYSLPHVTRWIVSLSMIGVVSSAVLSFALLPVKSTGLGAHGYFIYFFQWLLMPLTLIMFGTIPAMEAQTRLALGGKYRLGFWVTPKGRKQRIGDK